MRRLPNFRVGGSGVRGDDFTSRVNALERFMREVVEASHVPDASVQTVIAGGPVSTLILGSTTLAALQSSVSSVNNSGKLAGVLVEDETGRVWRALGGFSISSWRPLDDASGISDITPA